MQIPSVVSRLTSLTNLFLRFNRIRYVDDDIRLLKVLMISSSLSHWVLMGGLILDWATLPMCDGDMLCCDVM